MAGYVDVGIAGGADSSSVAPIGVSKKFARVLLDLSKARSLGQKISLIRQLGLKDIMPVPPAVAEYSTGISMGQTAEQMAKTHNISREAQDELAHRSHTLATKSWQEGKLAGEVMTAHSEPYKSIIEKDNCIRENSELASYKKLRPDRVDGVCLRSYLCWRQNRDDSAVGIKKNHTQRKVIVSSKPLISALV